MFSYQQRESFQLIFEQRCNLSDPELYIRSIENLRYIESVENSRGGGNEVIVNKFLGLTIRQLVKLGHVPNEFSKSRFSASKRIRSREACANI